MSILYEKNLILLDGAMGTRLFAAGLGNGDCPEKWILASPEHEKITADIQRGYAAAGSDILYTPTFGANRAMLEKNGICGKTAEINRRLAGITRAVADEYGTLTAGDISSSGLFMKPVGDTGFEELKDIFREQAMALDEAGVDFFAIETQISLEETRAALIAIQEFSDKPVITTLTLEKAGRTMSGDSPAAAMIILRALGADVFGFNCSQGPAAMHESFSALAGYIPQGLRLAAKPNAGLPHDENGSTVFDASPEEFACDMKALAALGVSFLGGCCGSDDRYIEALSGIEPKQPEYSDTSLFAANARTVFPVHSEMSLSDKIECDDSLIDSVMCAGGDILNLTLSSPESAEKLTEAAMYIDRPVMLSGDYASLEAALEQYCARVIISGDSQLTANEKNNLTGRFNPVTFS